MTGGGCYQAAVQPAPALFIQFPFPHCLKLYPRPPDTSNWKLTSSQNRLPNGFIITGKTKEVQILIIHSLHFSVAYLLKIKSHPDSWEKKYGVSSSGRRSQGQDKLLVSERKMTVPQIIYTWETSIREHGLFTTNYFGLQYITVVTTVNCDMYINIKPLSLK